VIQIDWAALGFSPATLDELVAEFREYKPIHFVDGQWKSMNFLQMMLPAWFRFDHGFGRRYAMPMFLEELRPLPELIPTLREAGFYVGGFNAFVDWVILPIGMGVALGRAAARAPPGGPDDALGLKRFGVLRTVRFSSSRRRVPRRRRSAARPRRLPRRRLRPHRGGDGRHPAPGARRLGRKPGLHFQALLADPSGCWRTCGGWGWR